MPGFLDPVEPTRDVVASATTRYDGTRIKTRTAFEAREITSTSIIPDWKIQSGTSAALIQDPATSVSQNRWPWQGSWHSGAGPWGRPWDGIPTTIITLASAATYTELPSTAHTSQLSSLEPNASEPRIDGPNINGPAAAGIGIGASIGLFGLCFVAIHSYRKHLRRRNSSVQTSRDVQITQDTLWPPYPYSASNESPVELSAIRQAKEMSAEERHREKDASNDSEIAELDGEWYTMRKGGK
ncbi:hypothetical protein GGR58DRAFT_470469 [Xylaria digitata]|nr:hypothetical protein GGR58DRAFT_470469 [Xylaria digitata]